MKRALAGLTAIAGCAALALQLALTLSNTPSVGAGLWLYLGFFTILTNLLVAAMASALATGRTRFLTGTRTRMALTAAIVMVGAAYWLLLAGTWKPQGWQLVADVMLHTTQPLFAIATWWAWRDGHLNWSDVPSAAIWPAAYAVYALGRGAADGWYAYWFLDPTTMGWGGIALSVAGLSALVMTIAAVLVWADGKMPADARE